MTIKTLGAGHLVLLGCGKMGSALLSRWLEAGLAPAQVHVIDPHPSDWLRARASEGLALNAPMPGEARVCVIAVKPQMMGAALPGLVALGGGKTLMLSIAAGTPISAFETIFGPQTPIVRAMPNTPALVGRAISALIGNASAGTGDMGLAEALMGAVGQTVRLASEDQMDAVTALSGSGPAYVFHMIEALAAAGEAEGLPGELAMQLARATVGGAGQLAETARETPAELRVNVTSPKGTTEAGLAVLMDPKTGLSDVMRRTVAAAAARSRALRG